LCFQVATAPKANQPATASAPFDSLLLVAAAEYQQFPRADGPMHWSPTDCAWPRPAHPRYSASADEDTHGRKLYSVYIKDQAAYRGLAEKDQPAGQALVKEAWLPEEVPDDGRPIVRGYRSTKDSATIPGIAFTINYVPYVRKDGRLYHATTKS